jgi:membrane peptidoglycan carboxypeptidase
MGGPGGPGGRRPAAPRSWWRTWTWKKALIFGGVSFGGLVIVFFLAGFIGYSMTSIPAALASAQQQNSIVYYSDGTTEMGTIGTTNRTDLSLNQIPATMQDAFIAAEDKNFYHEGGVSPTGILRATLDDVASSGGSLNGGSTLTQEFVRNYYGLGLQQTASRKIKEIFLSEKLADTKSKQWILNSYLNMVYLGDNSYGVEAASQTYFGEPASKLTISQDALLAGLPQQPSTYPLPEFKSALKARWSYVLAQMVRNGYITQAQANAQKFPTLLTWADPSRGEMASRINPASSADPWEPYILAAVENELGADGVTQSELDAGGLKIVTNVSLAAEKAMYSAVNNTLSSSNLEANGSQYSTLPSWALTGAEVQDPQTGAITALYPGKGQNQSASECAANDCDQDTALYHFEQVGSSFKPYVVAAAVQQGMNVQSSVMDTSSYACIAPPSEGSTTISQPVTEAMYKQASANGAGGNYPPCPNGYFPEENDAGEQIGQQNVATGTGAFAGADYAKDTVQDALAQSSNVAFTDLIHRTGTLSAVHIAEEVGASPTYFPSSITNTVGTALGEADMSVNNQASLVAMLADNGTYHTAHIVKSWQDTTGGVTHTPTVKSTQVLTPAQASQVQYAMEKTTVDGTAKGLVQLSEDGQQVIGKTGTTTSNHSGFFIGATPKFAMAVGMFTTSSSNSSQDLGLLDSSDAANIYPTMIWNAFANAEYPNADQGNFETLDTTGTTAWNMLGNLPKSSPKPKTSKSPSPKKCKNGGGGILGLGGNNGNCTGTAAPTTAPPTGPGTQPSQQPSSTPTCTPGILSNCTPTQPPNTSTATAPANGGGGGGAGGGRGGGGGGHG